MPSSHLATIQTPLPMLPTAAQAAAISSDQMPSESTPFGQLLDNQRALLTDGVMPTDGLLGGGEQMGGMGDALAALMASLAFATKVSPADTAPLDESSAVQEPVDALAALMASLAFAVKVSPTDTASAGTLLPEDQAALVAATMPAVLPAQVVAMVKGDAHSVAALVAPAAQGAALDTGAMSTLVNWATTPVLTATPFEGAGQDAMTDQSGALAAAAPLPATATAAGATEFSAVLGRVAQGGAAEVATNGGASVEPLTPAGGPAQAHTVARHDIHPGESRLAQPVGTPAWNSEVGQKVLWMAQRQEGRAELVLTPPQMGRIEISLQVNHDQANAIFTSANPVVREALEAALPRLREVLLEAGIQLGQAQVGADPRSSQQQPGENRDNRPTGELAHGEQSLSLRPQLAESAMPLRRGLVDTFA